MEVKAIFPPVSPFLQVKLDQEIIDYLWRIIDIAESKNKSLKSELAGNISKSLKLYDIDSFFCNSVCAPLVSFYRKNTSKGVDPISPSVSLSANIKLVLNKIWVNYQYETEFNPYHDHSGVYSFTIWLKIPYDWNDQKELQIFRGIKEGNSKAGNFEFEYIDTLGGVRNVSYNLSPRYEGTMLFFPAKLRHCVYPFYKTSEPRISIAGNLSYVPC